jgi:hypothetical protein
MIPTITYKQSGDGGWTARVTNSVTGEWIASRSNHNLRTLQLLIEREYLQPARYQAVLAAERKE